ncbi:MAG: hypothetical protein R2814_14835 [Flavobacteriaceae bacterium]
MILFIILIVALVLGHFAYRKLVEKIFGVDRDCPIPAIRLKDDMDIIPLTEW